MGEYNAITSIPSCCDQGYFHKKCAQEHALTAGYLTKCPCCGNKTSKDGIEYREFIKRRGIFVPDEDAGESSTRKCGLILPNLPEKRIVIYQIHRFHPTREFFSRKLFNSND